MLYRRCFQHLYDVRRKRIVTPERARMRLNRGEHPEPLPESLRQTLRTKLNLRTLQQYPSYPKFYNQLAQHFTVAPEWIVAGAGIEEFIRTLMFLSCDPGDKAVVLWPTCAMYDIYAEAFGVDLIRFASKPDQPLGMAEFLTSIPESAKLIFVPNPGQPVETYFSPLQINVLAQYCHDNDIVLAIDEAHYGFGAQSALPLVHMHDNVLILRTFSKWFSAASIRVGCAIGQPRVIKPLDAVRPSGEVTGPSMQIASFLMEHSKELAEIQREVALARDWLRFTINAELPGCKAYGHYGRSLLVEFMGQGMANAVADALADRSILVKAGFPRPVDRCILLSCGSLALMKEFYKELKAVVSELRVVVDITGVSS